MAYRRVFPTAVVKAVAEVSIVLLAVKTGWWSIPCIAVGGSVGVIVSMKTKYANKNRRC
jgi:hypothetical protein